MPDRLLKVNELVRQQLGQLIVTEFEWPEGTLITVSEVKVSPDLRHAKVYVAILPDEREKEILGMLIKRSKEMRKVLGDNVYLRNVPGLRFFIDHGEKEAQKIDYLLDNLK
jgi:ribosome-binding factor A